MGNARGALTQRQCSSNCGNMTAILGRDDQGRKRYRSVCNPCHRKGRLLKADKCEWPDCTFVIEDKIQLDVDHKDGNRANNDPSNVWTLCANHHRLKTKRNKDGVYGQRTKD
jgi:5-methylcytosine-specific restriction endonuclease McrA